MTDLTELSQVMAAVPMPMLLVGRDARITLANPAAQSLLGRAEGRHFMTVIRQPEPVALLEAALAGGPGGSARWRVTGPGRDTIFRGECRTIAGLGASLAFEDVTDHEDIADLRRDFVANVSHELRTPLTAMLGFIETLRGAAKEDPVARERFLAIMEREALRMNRLVADLLSLSRVEAEERVRPKTLIDLAGLTTSAVTTLKGLAVPAGVELVLEVVADLPRVPGDGDQITQVLHNLIENAVKYGGSGGKVEITVMAVAHDPVLRGPGVAVRVTDFGEGIAPQHLPRLTERFYRADSHRAREKGGTGLGLAIVKHILNRHRGRLKIASVKGEGSQFEIVLPL